MGLSTAAPTLNLIGAGRVGGTLAQLWAAQGVFRLQAVLSRSAQAAHGLVGSLGQGQVVDAAIVDGSANLMNLLLSLRGAGSMPVERGAGLLDGPFWYRP